MAAGPGALEGLAGEGKFASKERGTRTHKHHSPSAPGFDGGTYLEAREPRVHASIYIADYCFGPSPRHLVRVCHCRLADAAMAAETGSLCMPLRFSGCDVCGFRFLFKARGF